MILKAKTMVGKPVFFDPTGKRGVRLKVIAWVGGMALSVTLVIFSAILVVVHRPSLGDSFDQQVAPQVSIRCAWEPSCSPAHPIADTLANPPLLSSASTLAAELRKKERDRGLLHSPTRAVPALLRGSSERPLSIGFYTNGDDNSYPALKRALPSLDWVLPGWLSLQGPNLDLRTDIDSRALIFIEATKPSVSILPMIQNAADGKWDGRGLARLLADPAARAARLNDIVAFLETNKFQGLTVDFEEVPPTAQKDLQAFLTEMSMAFRQRGLVIVLAIPLDDDSWSYATYGNIVDYVLLMAYDQHWETSAPGSIAGQDWFEKALDERMKTLDPSHTIVAMGGYGYDWVKGHDTQDLTFEEAVLSARDFEAPIEFDPVTANPHFSFVEDDGNRHDVWFLDGVTAFNEIAAGNDYRLAGYALWRIGSEDPSVWSVMGQPYGATAPAGLGVIGTGQDIDFEGNGEILHVEEGPKSGARTFKVDDKSGQIVDEAYQAIPTPFVIERTGDKAGELALTFDDGPDPEWTSKNSRYPEREGRPRDLLHHWREC